MIAIKWWHFLLVIIIIALGILGVRHLFSRIENRILGLEDRIEVDRSQSENRRGTYQKARKETKSIAQKWENYRRSDSMELPDSILWKAKLLESIQDISTMDSTLDKCDSLVSSLDKVICTQDSAIQFLKRRKVSPFGVFGGVGLGVNHLGQVAPTVVIGVGIKIK
jgi:hypothetical protein